MGQLTNQYVSQSYQGLLNLENATTGVTSTLQYVTDGLGNRIPMQASTSSIVISGSFYGDGSGLTGVTAVSSSYSNYAVSSSYASNATSSSFATNAATASIANDLIVVGKNNNASTLTKGTIVRIVGANGDNPLFDTASWEDDANSANTLGMLSDDVASNDFANVVVQGKVIGINTNGMPAGALLFLSSSGQYTTQSIPAPYHEVRLGQVLRSNISQGSAYISIDNGYELSELHDVDVTNPVVGDLLVYTSGSYGIWENKTASQIGLATTSSLSSYTTLTEFNNYTGSNDTKVNDLISKTGSYATITGQTALSASIASTDLSQNNRLTALEGVTGSINRNGLITTGSIGGSQSITGSLNVSNGAVTLDANVDITGGNLNVYSPVSRFSGSAVIVTGSLDVTGTITATSASVEYARITNLEVVYETSSVIYSSGSNQFGDASNDTQTLYGTVKLPTGPLSVTGSVIATNFTGSLEGTASYASNALSSSYSNNSTSASFATNALSASYAPDTTNTGSLVQTVGLLSPTDDTILVIKGDGTTSQFTIDNVQSSSFATNALSASWAPDNSNRNGLITTGSVGGSQSITGSINISNPSTSSLSLGEGSGGVIVSNYNTNLAVNVGGNNVLDVNIGQVDITGSLNVTQGITGSLEGTASYATNALSASYAPPIDTSYFATTGSNIFKGSETIETGSLIFRTPLNSIPYAVTESATGTGNNIYFGNITPAIQTGSFNITGSNNIITAQFPVTVGYRNFINGHGNVALGSSGMLLSTASLMVPNTSANIGGGSVQMYFTTSSLAGGAPVFSNNYVNGFTTLNIPSGSLTAQNNNVLTALVINAAVSTHNTRNAYSFNYNNSPVTLNAFSSSIAALNNTFNGAVTVNNHYTSSNTTGNQLAVNRNAFFGQNHILNMSGSNDGSTNFTAFNDNLIAGNAHTIQRNVTGSNSGSLTSTGMIGNGLGAIATNRAGGNDVGSVFVGRWNDTGSLANSNQIVFAVGTGTGASSRRTGLSIDSGSNAVFSGSLTSIGPAVVSGSINTSDRTFVVHSGSMRMYNESGSIRIADGTNQAQLFFNPTRKIGFFLGQSNMDQTDTQFGITSGSTDNYTFGGNFNNFRTGSNNLMLGNTNIQIKSGSNNVILAKQTSYTTGSNNLILGSIMGIDEVQNYFNLQLPSDTVPIMFKSGSSALTISGSFNIKGGSTTITGSVQGNVLPLTVTSNTASLNLNNGNFFELALTGSQDIRIEPSNIKPGQTINIKLNTTGSGTVSFPTSVKQPSGSAYVPTTAVGTDIITMVSFDTTNLFMANVKNLI